MSINTVAISGNLTKDAELRTFNSGSSVLDLSIAVNERRKDANGEWSDYANFIEAKVFGARAAKIAGFLVKGTKVMVQGKLRWEQWDDKNNGSKRSKVYVIADEIEFSGGQKQQQAAPAPKQYGSAPAPAPQQYNAAPADAYYAEDAPF